MEDITDQHPQLPISNHHKSTFSPLHNDQEQLSEDRVALCNLARQVKKLIKREKAHDQKILKMQSRIDLLKEKITRIESEDTGCLGGNEKTRTEDGGSDGGLSDISTGTKTVLDRVFPCLPLPGRGQICCYPNTTMGSQIIQHMSPEDAEGVSLSTGHRLDHRACAFAHPSTSTDRVSCGGSGHVMSSVMVKHEYDHDSFEGREGMRLDTARGSSRGSSSLVCERLGEGGDGHECDRGECAKRTWCEESSWWKGWEEEEKFDVKL
ncbi:hypothetical protein HOY82DRAFT_593643 [Tuber indicum]|nr:hypothetical protein HOY82DRAFT_593643 [Tuber indicum]